MPHKSLREIRASLRRELLSTEHFSDALLVVRHPDGHELLRAGGLWDTTAECYSLERPAVPTYVKLNRAQVEPDPATGLSIADGLARYFRLMRQGIDAGRIIILMAEGERGSGKTWFLGSLVAVLMALEHPRGAQFSVNVTSKQKREVLEGIQKIVSPDWLLPEVKDQRDPFLPFVTGHALYWRTGRAPAAIREGGIDWRYGFVNEGQDQHEDVALNAVGAIRNIGTLVGIATNPDPDGGWVADLKEAIESGGEGQGERYHLPAALNENINQATQPKIAWALGAISKDAADADARGIWRRRGAAFPSFTSKPRRTDETGRYAEGHIGVPPVVEVGRRIWRDVTREETERVFGSPFDNVGGTDFQHEPGCCAGVGKLYRNEFEELIIYIREFIGAPGDERSFAQALEDRGYVPGDVDFDGKPAPGRSLLLVADGTGDIQDSTHRRGNPYSFAQLKKFGWKVIPPMRHRASGKPCNPLIPDSLKQMDTALRAGWILLDPACGEPAAEFCSLVDGFKKSTLNASGKFVKKHHFTHGPDGVRYLAWRFLPRNRMDLLPTAPALSIFDAVKKKG